MSLHRRAAKRDTTENPIKAALEVCGADIWKVSGEGLPDLLVHFRGRWTPLEVKSDKKISHRRAKALTPAQQQSATKARWPVVETIAEALAAVGIRLEGPR